LLFFLIVNYGKVYCVVCCVYKVVFKYNVFFLLITLYHLSRFNLSFMSSAMVNDKIYFRSPLSLTNRYSGLPITHLNCCQHFFFLFKFVCCCWHSCLRIVFGVRSFSVCTRPYWILVVLKLNGTSAHLFFSRFRLAPFFFFF
jgi:hypothetical protein